MNKKVFGLIATISSAVMFGFLPLLVKSICAEGTNTLSCVVIRFGVALPMIYVLLKIKGISLKITRKEFFSMLLISVCGYGGTSVLLFSSYNYIPSGMSTTIHYMYPMLTMLGLTIILKEKLTVMKVVAQVMCVVGILLFYTGEGGANATGIILAAVSSLTYSFYTIYLGNSCLKEMNDFKLLFYMGAISAVCVFIASLASGTFDCTITLKGWILIIVFALLASFIGSLGYQFGVKYIGGQAASILSTMEPVTSVIVGAIVFNELVTAKTVLGCISILGAATITSIISGRKDTKEKNKEERKTIHE